jgi:hypothetical protein
VILPMPYISQSPYHNLCWAACCAMVLRHYGTSASVLDVLRSVRGNGCANATPGSACDAGVWPDQAFPHLGMRCDRATGAASPGNVQFEINRNRPVEVYFAWDDGGNHVAIISGYDDNDNSQLHVKDPLMGEGTVSHAHLMSAYGKGSWDLTFFNIEPHHDG